jgi:hypothetical protein
MYAGTGISTDSARREEVATKWAKWTARQCKKLFEARPMPDLAGPEVGDWDCRRWGRAAFAGAEGAC